MTSGDAVLGSIWNSRAQLAIGFGRFARADRTDNLTILQANAIPKGSPKAREANLFIDYSLSPDVQARWLSAFKSIPINTRAYHAAAPTLIDPDTKEPWTKSKGFLMDNMWWAKNRAVVSEAWSKWVIEG